MGYVDEAVKKDSGVVIVVAPEGTRKKSPKWKSGFLRIAEKNNCKIQLGALDFPNKRIVLGDVFEPTGDNQADIAAIIEYYGQFKGKHPERCTAPEQDKMPQGRRKIRFLKLKQW